ncbi:MAG TPA: hypothetical protein VK308_15675, partial [Pyrinomonadaceae bacterium]|nr:hypothetical protein [Pyrinomonadaceae bacterium]
MKPKLKKNLTETTRRNLLKWLETIFKDNRCDFLLNEKFNPWLLRTRDAHGFPLDPLKMDISAESLKKYWQSAIKRATLDQLTELNNMRFNQNTALSADDSDETGTDYLRLRISYDFSGSDDMAGITKFHIDIYK